MTAPRGSTPTLPSTQASPSGDSAEHDAIIVGAGFGGMGAAIQLNRSGFDNLLILDREDDLGGTWHVNHYPGLAVDIPSSTYSYSFEPNPNWSRLFAPGNELKQYAVHVAEKYNLRRYMRFNTAVRTASWDETAGHWTVTTDAGTQYTAQYLLTATGFLSQPMTPEITGIDTFAGQIIHTANWPDGVDLTGKRIGVIGTGATSVQLVPELAKVAGELTVYQRTPIWISVKPDFGVPTWLRRLYAKVPFTQRIARAIGSSVMEVLSVIGVVHYRRFWWLNKAAEGLSKFHAWRQVKDPATRKALTPTYSFGCKRPTYSNTYFPTFNRPNVHLETTPIQQIDASGVIAQDGSRTDLDVLITATGFNLWDSNFPAFEVLGRDGKNLGQWWRDGRFQAYEGLSVPGFPNFFTLHSPYSYTGLSYFWAIEAQMKHMARLFGAMRERGATRFEISTEANDRFLAEMTKRVQSTIFMQGNCAGSNSYYYNPHGEATLLRPMSVLAAHRSARRFPIDDYELK